MSAQDTAGKLIGPDERRDAIHFAVAPTVARQELKPGQHCGADGTTKAPVGIVDPFLNAAVKAGERFWLMLYPNTITSLRHEWEHPAFGQEPRVYLPAGVSASEAWIRNLCGEMDISYEEMMRGAEEWIETQGEKYGPEYLVQQGSDSWRDDFPKHATEFWQHYEVVTGAYVPTSARESFFSCSC